MIAYNIMSSNLDFSLIFLLPKIEAGSNLDVGVVFLAFFLDVVELSFDLTILLIWLDFFRENTFFVAILRGKSSESE